MSCCKNINKTGHWTEHIQHNICLGVCLQNTHTQNDFPLIIRWGVRHNPMIFILRLWKHLFHISKNTLIFLLIHQTITLQIFKMRQNCIHQTAMSHLFSAVPFFQVATSTQMSGYIYTLQESSHFQGSRSVSLCEGGSLRNPNSDGTGSLTVTVESIRATTDTVGSQKGHGLPCGMAI